MRRFGSEQVRVSGTVGGNIANGSPIGDLPPAMIALGAKLFLRRGGASRALPLEEFFLDYGKQDRQPGEFVVGVAVMKLRPGDFFRCYKVSKRFEEDISAVMGAFKLSVQKASSRKRAWRLVAWPAIPKRAAAATESALRRPWSRRGLRLERSRRGGGDGFPAAVRHAGLRELSHGHCARAGHEGLWSKSPARRRPTPG